MRIRMPILAAGVIAGLLAVAPMSADANQAAPLAGFYADSSNSVIVDATPEAIGEMCYIIQGGQLIGGATLNGGVNLIPATQNGMGDTLMADGPGIMATSTSVGDTPCGSRPETKLSASRTRLRAQ